jgi:hypothetical protein
MSNQFRLFARKILLDNSAATEANTRLHGPAVSSRDSPQPDMFPPERIVPRPEEFDAATWDYAAQHGLSVNERIDEADDIGGAVAAHLVPKPALQFQSVHAARLFLYAA